MTNTTSAANAAKPSGARTDRRGRTTGVGLAPHKRTGIDVALALLTPIVGQEFLDKYRLRDPLNRSLRYGVKTMFATAGAATRQFQRVQGLRGGPTRLKSSGRDYFDLTPDDDQKLIIETVDEFAEEVLRPAAHDADDAATYPSDLTAKAAELGITAINIPRTSTVSPNTAPASPTCWWLRHWRMATWAWHCRSWRLAGGVRAHPLGQRRSAGHLSQRVRRRERSAGLRGHHRTAATIRSHPAEDHRGAHPVRLPARRREVVDPGRRRRRAVYCRRAAGRQARTVHCRVRGQRPDRQGGSEHGDSRRGVGPGRTLRVSVPLNARLGEDEASDNDYSEALALARLGWAALAVGTSHAVLDYVVPYVKQRQAFGEPIAHRQAVAFMCANIAIELDGLRLITWRGASRAEQGLPFAREAALAKRLGSDKGMQIGLDGVQLLGGHGYTKEHPVERWYRDLRAIGVAEGVVVI